MTDLSARLALKARLPRSWPAFFERHGNFTSAQLATIPAVLAGHNVIVCAPTAGGKTEAAIAPLIERHCPPTSSAHPPPSRPRILYLTPTRALANDLAARLAPPLAALGLSLGVKTSDMSTFRPSRPPDVLITTPESADSTLTAHAKLFANLRAIIIDELHLFDGTPRGDQLRVILSRIRWVRDYACTRGDAPDRLVQYAALSATIAEPAAAAARYFADAQVIRVAGGRAIAAELLAISPDSGDALADYLATFRAKGWRKALAFCNSRAEIEAYAAITRECSPFGSAVYVHYSNIEPGRRRMIERQFADADTAICFASSTLELGVDIGDIDVVILIGPPGSPGSFIQRIGRGNRRRGTTHVACFYRTPLERLLFETLSAQPDSLLTATPAAFRPAVAIQQIFSLLKQSPTAALRLAELGQLFADMLSPADLLAILGELQLRDYLKVGRPGEWRAGDRLNKLFDEQIGAHVSLSIYSNIQSSEAALIDIRDQHTQETVARVDAQWFDRPVLTLEGRPVNVQWSDGEVLWVASYQGRDLAEQLRYRSARQFLSYELARGIPQQLGLPPNTAPFVAAPEGWWWFHWLGDRYGRAALDLLRYRIAAHETEQIGLCLRLPDEPQAPPAWTEAQVTRYLADNYRLFEPMLALGPFQHLLPLQLRRRAVVEQFDVAGFLQATSALRPLAAPEALTDDLTSLLAE
jgi:ATP-dependent Lhr-like helicase